MTSEEIHKRIIADIKDGKRKKLRRDNRTQEEFFADFSIEKTTLDDAVLLVKLQNSTYYHPNRYKSMIQDVTGDELEMVVIKLIKSGSALTATLEQLVNYPNLITIEDFIKNKSDGYGFPKEIIELAKWNSEQYLRVRKFANQQRFIYRRRQ